MKKKLLILNDIAPEDGIGGQATFLLNIIPYLSEQYDVKLLTLPRKWVAIKWIPRRLMSMIYTIFHRSELKKADIIFSNTPETAYVATYVNPTRLFHIFHGNTNALTTSKFWYGRYFRWVFSHFDNRITDKAKLCYTVGEERPRNKFLYQPIDTRLLASVAPAREGRSNFLFVGRLEEVKQVDRIILAYADYLKRYGRDDRLVVCGIGILEDGYKKAAVDAGVSDMVDFMGKTAYNDVIAQMRSSKCLLMGSLYEGFPMVIAECLSCGLPVVSTRVGSIAKVIKPGYNGELVPVDFTPQVYADTLHQVSKGLAVYTAAALESARVFNAGTLVQDFLKKDFETA